MTNNAGPHGMHAIGQACVDAHHTYARDGQYTSCAYCHGGDYKGSPLWALRTSRSFKVEDTTQNFPPGNMIGCFDCHNGLSGGG